jgi:hypothetical protein
LSFLRDASDEITKQAVTDSLDCWLNGLSIGQWSKMPYDGKERQIAVINVYGSGRIFMTWDEKLALYDQLVAKCPRFERKGKTVPYTSANGHMFSLLNKDGELGFRYSKEVQEKYIQEFGSSILKSYGAVMRGYVLIPDEMFEDLDNLAEYLNESYDYVMSLEPK